MVSSDFASTCAQLLPVFGLATIAELVIFGRVMRQRLADREGWRRPEYWVQVILPGLIVYVLWAWVIFRISTDELLCLDALRHVTVPSNTAASVRGTIDAAITILIVLPTIGIPFFWLLGLLRDISKENALKRGHAYLDDEVEFCMVVEPDYRFIPGKVNIVHPTRARETGGRPGRESLEAPSTRLVMRGMGGIFRLLRVARRAYDRGFAKVRH